MSTTGQLTAKPPVSPHANLSAIARTGTTKCGSAIWSLTCTCGASLSACAPHIKKGTARCPSCNPRAGAAKAISILDILPATYAKIMRKTKLTEGQVRYRIELMREKGMCHVGDWGRADQQGSYAPVFHAGPGEDAPCALQPRPRLEYERRYRKRVKAAIQKAEETGKEDARYARQISLRAAKKTVMRTRTAPQNPFSALFMGGRHA